MIVNKDKPFTRSNLHGPSYSAYVTFASEEEASVCILAIDGFDYNRRTLKASYGMTKYCSFFIKNTPCPNEDCLYLHKLAAEKDSFSKEEGNPAKYVQKVSQRDIIEYVIASNKDFWKLARAGPEKLGVGFAFPGPQVSWAKIRRYCRERSIPYTEPREVVPKKVAPAKVEKKENRLITSKWSQEEELPIFPLKNAFESEEELAPVGLEKSTSVRVDVVRTEGLELSRSNVDYIQAERPVFTPKQRARREVFSPKSERNTTSIGSRNDGGRASPDKLAQEQTRDTTSHIPPAEEEITSEMEEVLERLSGEYSELDRQIMQGLNKSYFRLKMQESRLFAEKSHSESAREMRTKCTDIRNIIDQFLQPNTALLAQPRPRQTQTQPQPHTHNGGPFRLFGQSYTLSKPSRP